MQSGQIIHVRTNPVTQFIGTLAQNAGVDLSLGMAPAGTDSGDGYVDPGLGAGGSVRARLRSINIVSVQNLDWELWLWSTSAFNASATVPGSVYPLGRWGFAAANAARIAAAGLYYYYVDGLDVAYFDGSPRTGNVHMTLVNRNAVTKAATTAGAILIQLGFENSYGI